MAAVVTLWTATRPAGPNLGAGSCWCRAREEAEHYLHGRTPGFGGDALYRVKVKVDDARKLDLMQAPWAVLNDQFGLERDDYDAGEMEHELLRQFHPIYAAHGYQWVIFPDSDKRGHLVPTWLYCGHEELPAERVN